MAKKQPSGKFALVDVTVTLKVAVSHDKLDVDKGDFDDYDEFAQECQDVAITNAEEFVNGLVKSHPNEIHSATDIDSEYDEDSPMFAYEDEDDEDDDE